VNGEYCSCMHLSTEVHARRLNMSAKTASSAITIQDRLEVGNLTIDEVCKLKPRSRSGFYSDLRAGLVQIRKLGRNSIVPGPVARRYINGYPQQ
jgi:hypothetical protein